MCCLSFIWIIDMASWNSIQDVSCYVSSRLYLNHWHASIKSYPECELLCLLDCIWIINMLLWNPIQEVSCCVPSKLYLNHWHAPIKFHPGCELLCVSQALFESLICFYKIPSSLWVAVCLLSSIWITDMPLWNHIQVVSCFIPPGLYLDHWYVCMKFHLASELLCAFCKFYLNTLMKFHPECRL